MRLAPSILWFLVGLPIAVGQFALTSRSASAWWWDAEPSRQLQSPPGGARYAMPVPGATPSWSNGEVPSQASTSRPIVDPSVQQAGWSDPARSAGRPVVSNPAITGPPRARSMPPGRKGPMFRGYELRLPATLFGRNKETTNFPTAAKPIVRGSADAAHAQVMRGMPNPSPARSGSMISSQVTRPPAGGMEMARSGDRPQQWMGDRPQQSSLMSRSLPATGNIQQGLPANAGRPVRATIAADPQSRVPVPDAETTSSTDFRSAQPRAESSALSRSSAPAPNHPSATKEGSATTTQNSEKSAAEKLAAQAHEWSATAKSEPEFTRIIETCRRARVSEPAEPVAKYVNELAAWALNRRGQLKAEKGLIKEAMLDFDDAIRTDSKCWRATHNRGVLLAQDGQFEKAFDDFSRTIDTSPEFAKAYSNRAALFVVASNLPAALQDYGRAIELDPNLAIAHRGRGRVCHLLGQLDEAIGHYDAAVQLAPDDAYAIASRADLLTDLGRYIDANADYNRAIEIDPHSVHAYSGSAWLLATCPDSSIRDPELAVRRARISIELSGEDDAVSFDTLAAALASAGDFDAATKSVRQALELASADERDIYHDRLLLYQHAKPYRISPVRPVTQASYEE